MKTKKLKPGDRKAFVLRNIDNDNRWPVGWPEIVDAGEYLIYFGDDSYEKNLNEDKEFNYLVCSKLPKKYTPYENQIVVLELIASMEPSLHWNYPVYLWKLSEST